MNTCCPKCDTCYAVDDDALIRANCLAHCYRCGALFSVVGRHATEVETADLELLISALRLDQRCEVRPSPPPAAGAAAPARPAQLREPTPVRAAQGARTDAAAPRPAPRHPPGLRAPAAEHTPQPPEAPARPAPPAPSRTPREPAQAEAQDALPFAVPDDLEPLQPAPDVALDAAEALEEKSPRRGLLYGFLAMLLLGALGLQLAWQHRAALLARFPALEPVCGYVECRPEVVRAPERFRVLQRALAPTADTPGSLTLNATIRNDAGYAQPLPDMQLSLLDTDGAVLVRRRLSPADYLFPPPPADRLVAPGEVFTISLDFADPGYLATGFMLDFL